MARSRVPDRVLAADHHEADVLHVDVVEQREGDREDTGALDVVDVVDPHRVECLVVERVHRPHAALE